MKIVFVFYAIVGIIVQVLFGHFTGLGQGSIGVLTFLFLVEVDPRFRFAYIVPNVKKRHKENGDIT